MTRAFHLALHIAPFAMTVACVIWVLALSPFTAPMVQRSSAQIEAVLTRAMARDVTPEWLGDRAQVAIAAQDLIQIEMLIDLSVDHDAPIDPALLRDMADIVAAQTGYVANAVSCGRCATDIASCVTMTHIGICAVPFELSPAGDVNALRRAGVDYASGADVDRLDVGLALVGLGATGAVLATGGSSYTLKAGTSALRMARKLGTLTPALAARLSTLLGQAVHWDRLGDLAALRIGPAEMLDSAKMGELSDIGGSLRRVVDQTSPAEAVTLLRYVDTADDAATLARVSDALGPRTRHAFAVLGKARVLRATVRLSDLAISAAFAIYALAIQMVIFFGQQCGNACLRGARHFTKPKSI